MQRQFNLSWKTITLIALMMIALLIVSREIREWQAQRVANTLVNQLQTAFTSSDDDIEKTKHRLETLGSEFEQSVEVHHQAVQKSIDDAPMAFERTWQESKSKMSSSFTPSDVEAIQKPVEQQINAWHTDSPPFILKPITRK